MFNDDIQGTGAVILAGIINAVRRTGIPVRDHRAVLMGAGSAAVGVAKQIVEYFMNEGLTEDEARRCFSLVDTKGLVTDDRGDTLADHKRYFSRKDNAGKQYRNLAEVVDYVKPTILLGLSTIGGIFDSNILTKMGRWNKFPIIFPLSNPSTKSECTYDDAMKYTEGRALFASGSPFPSLQFNGKLMTPGQGQSSLVADLHLNNFCTLWRLTKLFIGNNMYVFPGIGLGSILCKATTITQSMIYASATSLSTSLTSAEKSQGWLYPDIARVRDASVVVAMGVIRAAQKAGVAREPSISDMNDRALEKWIRERMYDPHQETQNAEKEVQESLEWLSNTGATTNGVSSHGSLPHREKAHLWMRGTL